MKYIDEFRNRTAVLKLAEKMHRIMPASGLNIMEVCGTHTHNFYRFGLNKIIPQDLKLISGPGCPVCVSPQSYIDQAISLSKNKEVIILTFGDMLRVPGTKGTLEQRRAESGNVHMVYSPLESLRFAKLNPDKKIVFLGVGFETTAPTIALSILSAEKEKISNLYFLNSLKLITPAMRSLLADKKVSIDAFLCPGHVSAIIGSHAYKFIAAKYKINCCVAGFEPLDIIQGLYLLLAQIRKNKPPAVLNQYRRVVLSHGNTRAIMIMRQVFGIDDASWRGLGMIAKSALVLKNRFLRFDAQKQFQLKETKEKSNKINACLCAKVLKGLIRPDECPLFRKTCTPDKPFGPCMISQEGACNAYFRYR